MEDKKISIVTPSFNQGQYIEETINSVLDQRYPNLQYIIIDGGSTDNSVEVIKKYKNHLHYWVSKKDNGQASAINNGLQYCEGEIFNWLNSDDHLTKGALQKIANAFNNDHTDLVAGKVNNYSENSNEIIANQFLSAAGLMRWDKNVQFVQPGVWMRRRHLLTCGGLNEEYHYAFDWDMLIRYLYHFTNVKYLDDVLVNFRLHKDSKTVSALDGFLAEERIIIEGILADAYYTDLHPVCKEKVALTDWSLLLQQNIADRNTSRMVRVKNILTNLPRLPPGTKVKRMTLGAIKQILLPK